MAIDRVKPDGYPSAPRAWYLVVILSLGVLLSYTDRLIINLVVLDIRTAFALSDLKISLLQGLGFALIYATAGLPVGRIADLTNRRNLVASGIAIWSLATLACGLATTFEQFFILRMVVGLGEAILMPAAASMIADAFPIESRGRAMGGFGIGAMLGSGIALTLGALLLQAVRSGLLANIGPLNTLAPWRNVFILAGIPGLLLLPLFLSLNEPERHDRGGRQPLSLVLLHLTADRGRIARTCLAIGVIAAGDYGLLSWLPSLLERSYGLSPLTIGSVVGGVLGVGGVAACVASGWLSDLIVKRFGLPARRRFMAACYVLCAAAGILCFLPGLISLIAGFVLWILGSVAGSVVGNTVLQEIVPNEMRATTSALGAMCSAMIGLGVGPTSVIVASHAFGNGDSSLRWGIAVICSMAAAGGLALLRDSPTAHTYAEAHALE